MAWVIMEDTMVIIITIGMVTVIQPTITMEAEGVELQLDTQVIQDILHLMEVEMDMEKAL
jgi:hypothetical protein